MFGIMEYLFGQKKVRLIDNTDTGYNVTYTVKYFYCYILSMR